MLSQGVDIWNAWRRINPDIHPDLSNANLVQFRLNSADFSNTNLCDSVLNKEEIKNVVFNNADLMGVNFDRADLKGVDFSHADMGGCSLEEADLTEARLYGVYLGFSHLNGAKLTNTHLGNARIEDASLNNVDLSNANLQGTLFINTELENSDFSFAQLGGTVFGLTDLGSCNGLQSVRVKEKCVIDFYTLQTSKSISRAFLKKIGLSELLIDYLPELTEKPINLFPVFLSHSWGNKDFAGKLYEALIDKGVQVWYDEKKMKPGDDLYEGISQGISTYDKMILVCSKESLRSWWVDQEINRLFSKERKYSSKGLKKANLLIPITIDDYIYEWDGAKSEDIRRFVIGDFRNWKDEHSFRSSLDNLIDVLNPNRKRDKPPTFLK